MSYGNLYAHLETLPKGKYRFPAFWGPGYDWVPDHNWGGTGAVGLQEMLMQTLDEKIVFLPSWPDDWDCDFKLHAPLETTVTGKIRGGKIEGLEVHPEHRMADGILFSRSPANQGTRERLND